MNNNVKPWDIAPFEVITSLPIKVFVIDLQHDDNVKYTIDLDLGVKDHRVYLGKITAWAVRNRFSVETMNAKDAEGEG